MVGAAMSIEDSLYRALSCTPGDVALNRQGKVAPSQRNRLLLKAAGWSVGVVLCGLLLLGAGIPALRNIDFWSVLFVLVLGALLVSIAVFLGRRAARLCRDAIEGRVEQVEGRVTKSERQVAQGRGGTRTEYSLAFAGTSRKFEVDRSLYKVVVSDNYYRAFFAPRSQVIVGMEVVTR